ncbi:MAG: lytic transglycosylase domain-containing protein [Deltaproteobacteria bacterium]|jgi:hypothetical protein|nr:lytic transglycosylase domain-containing protein [Deltaproteobacteria bacterium]
MRSDKSTERFYSLGEGARPKPGSGPHEASGTSPGATLPNATSLIASAAVDFAAGNADFAVASADFAEAAIDYAFATEDFNSRRTDRAATTGELDKLFADLDKASAGRDVDFSGYEAHAADYLNAHVEFRKAYATFTKANGASARNYIAFVGGMNDACKTIDDYLKATEDYLNAFADSDDASVGAGRATAVSEDASVGARRATAPGPGRRGSEGGVTFATALCAVVLAAVAALILILLLIGASEARAELSPVTFGCLEDSVEAFRVPLAMILVVMDTESGKVGLASQNADGSRDLGPMQVNTFWLPRLEGMGVTEEMLRDNGCVNVAVAAWILRGCLSEGKGHLDALMSYHSRKPHRRAIYLRAALARAPRLDVERTLARANGTTLSLPAKISRVTGFPPTAERRAAKPAKTGAAQPVKTGAAQPVKTGAAKTVKTGATKTAKTGSAQPEKTGAPQPVKTGTPPIVGTGNPLGKTAASVP